MADASSPWFSHYIGIDYSGARTPTSSLKGLRVYEANVASPPREVPPPPSPRRYWTRKGAAEWLAEQLRAPEPRIVGIDHAFSFPLQYFEEHRLARDWPAFLEDFHQHWPTDGDAMCVEFVRDGLDGEGRKRGGDSHWKRVTDRRSGGAKSVFHFDVPGSVAKSTHAGLPWLRYLRHELGARVHFWPFDGWEITPGRSAIVEVYPARWSPEFPREGRSQDQQDAYAVAAWFRAADASGRLAEFLCPSLTESERAAAEIEGWILGVM